MHFLPTSTLEQGDRQLVFPDSRCKKLVSKNVTAVFSPLHIALAEEQHQGCIDLIKE